LMMHTMCPKHVESCK